MGRARIPPRKIPANINPPGKRCITFIIPDDDEWEQIAYSTLYDQLALVWMNWVRTGDDTGSQLSRRWREILRTWRHCEPTKVIQEDDFDMGCLCEQLRFQNGKLQALCCGVWTDVDGQSDNGSTAGSANQPSPAGTVVAGDCYSGTFTVDAVSGLKIPVPLVGGMTIQLTNMKGMWSGDLAITAAWHCPNGNVNVLGNCSLPGFVDPSNSFIPTSLFMCVVLVLVTSGVESYIDLSDGMTHTIPSGTLASEAYLAPNHNDAANNKGEITVDMSICAPVPTPPATTWCYTMDFSLSDYGWVVSAGSGGHYVSGTGFVSDTSVPTDGDQASIEFALPSATYTEWQAFINTASSAVHIINFILVTGSTSDTLSPIFGDHLYTSPTTPVTGDMVRVLLADRPADGVGQFIVRSVVFQGTGTNPFGSDNC
jgi:hypothetical protein